MGKLVLVRADGSTQDIKLDRERLTIGRRADNDLCLAQPAVSGEHAAVVTIFRDSFLEDVGSTNGTLVNGQPITKHFLRNRDEIDIGRQILVYLSDDDARIEHPAQRRSQSDIALDGGRGELPVSPDKRRTEDEAGLRAGSEDAIQRFVSAEIENGDPIDATLQQELPVVPSDPSEVRSRNSSGFALKVASGAKAGQIVVLIKSETLIGRAGVQVAALRRVRDVIQIVPVEGSRPLRVNGTPVEADGRELAIGDVLDIAETTIEFIAAPS